MMAAFMNDCGSMMAYYRNRMRGDDPDRLMHYHDLLYRSRSGEWLSYNHGLCCNNDRLCRCDDVMGN